MRLEVVVKVMVEAVRLTLRQSRVKVGIVVLEHEL